LTDRRQANLALSFYKGLIDGLPPTNIFINEKVISQVPPYAHNLVGVGGFVVNDKDEVLVIEERFSRATTAHWKLPGGIC
jgi:hypothetical protein